MTAKKSWKAGDVVSIGARKGTITWIKKGANCGYVKFGKIEVAVLLDGGRE